MLTIADVLHGLDFPRSGWPRRGIPVPLCETVAQHSIKVARASVITAHARGWDPLRAAWMGLSHDFCEHRGYRGYDSTPFDGLSAEDKLQNERAVWAQLAPRLRNGDYLVQLWSEYAEGRTEMARTIKQLDKIDASMQAIRYYHQGHRKVEDFFPWVRERLSDERLIRVYDALMAERERLACPYERYHELLRSS